MASLSILPVLGAEAVYPSSILPRGGVGVPGAFVVESAPTADTVSFSYGYSATVGLEPTEWTTVPAAENVVIPFVPTSTGVQYLWVVEVDGTGLMGVAATRSMNVAEPGTALKAPPVVSVMEPEDALPNDGMIPLKLTLTEDLRKRNGWPVPRGAVTLFDGTTELARVSFDIRVKDVLVPQSQIGTGYRDLRVEYVQYPGAGTITETARICAASCTFSGGSAKVVSLWWGGNRSHPSYNSSYRVEYSGFSPTPLSYTYQWLRDGAAIRGATSVEYLSSWVDVGRQVSVRVTAHGARMNPRSVTSTPFTVRERDAMHVDYGLSSVGSSWESSACYCDTKDGDTAGTTDSGRVVEALIAFPASSSYITRVAPATDADNDTTSVLWFEMEGFVQGRGWEGLKEKSHTYYVGSVGENRRLEAFRVKPAGPHASFYDVWYRAYVPKYGWLGWAKNGEGAGTTGFGYRIEAVQMRVLPKGTRPSASGTGNAPFYNKATQNQVTVQAYLRPTGWKSLVHGGSTAGLTDTSQRLNAVRVDVDGVRYSGGVQVSAKVEGDGWRPYVSDTKVAGTYDGTDRTSAYRMRLTGEMAQQYDIYYRVHVAGTGWLGWARNGAGAGTESYTYRNTAVQVVLVKKGERPLMSGYGRAAYKR
ncbi:hypothetical protein ACFT2C_01010 [Promicromonospora sp. NPDC057138]|uniref:hypothetical protein n=1 Tax=Promicromonospora sp. NPDC057138 TaxID=3346031 RepID=UPI003632C54A